MGFAPRSQPDKRRSGRTACVSEVRRVRKVNLIGTGSLLVALMEAEQDKSVPWYQVVAGILAIPTGVLGVYGAVVLSKKTRLETRKLQIEIAQAEQATAPAAGEQNVVSVGRLASASRTPRAIAASIEGYVIRFILLYLAYMFVQLVLGVVSPLLGFSMFLFRDSPMEVQYVVGISGSGEFSRS